MMPEMDFVCQSEPLVMQLLMAVLSLQGKSQRMWDSLQTSCYIC